MSEPLDPWAWRKAAGVLKDKLPDVPAEELIRRVRSDEPIWQGNEREELEERLEREKKPRPPFVIHVSEMADFPDAVYIGRENGRKRLKRSKWANPFTVKDHGRTMAIAKFALLAARKHHGYPVFTYDAEEYTGVEQLTGKPLACWCRRSDEERTDANACHGDVLVELWKEASK